MFSRLQTYLPTAALALLIFYFGFHALTGDRGLLLARQRRLTLSEKKAELASLVARRQGLELEVKYLGDRNLSADLLEEKAHGVLGFVDPRDYVIRDRRPVS